MNSYWVKSLTVLFCIFLAVFKISLAQGCSSDGINCINCTDYQICNGGFPEERVISCKTGASCTDDQLKQCQMKLNCYALNECTESGIFPDVMVDSNYYVCLNDANSGFLKYDFTCPDGNFFDKSSLTCVPREVTLATTEVPSSSSVSTDPNPSAETSSSSSPTESTSTSSPTETTSPSSPTETTSSSSPTETTSSSSPTETTSSSSPTETTSPSSPTETTSSSSTTETTSSSSTTETTSPSNPTAPTSPPPTTPSTSTTSTTPIPTSAPFICMASGIFPNPDNCKMYYRCSTSLKAFFYICPGNSYFNENILKCSMIISPACQEQILKNSTSTIPPSTTTTPTTTSTTITPTTPTSTSTTTTTTTSTTTTAVPTTTTTATTTTQAPTTSTTPPSSTPFSCPMSGIFANPVDCKTYYRCSPSGQIFQYVCPGNTFYNEFTKRCSLIITPRCKILIQG